MRKNRIAILIIFFVVIAFSGYSQEEKWENPAGSIENAKVVIEKDKVINLRPVSRRFESIQIELPKAQKLTFAYNLSPTVDSLSSLQVIVRPKTMRDQPLAKFYGLSAKLGFGNYQSPFVLLNAGNKRSDEFLYNMQLNHFSSAKGDVNDAPYSSTRLGVAGKYFLNNFTIHGSAGFHNQAYRIYGYAPTEFPNISNPDFLKQRLNVFNLNLGFTENDQNNSSDQEFVIALDFLKNNHFDRELTLGADYQLAWQLATEWKLNLNLNYSLANQENSATTAINRHFAALRPSINYSFQAFDFLVGLNGFYQQDPVDNLSAKIYVFPNIGIRYAIDHNHALSFNIIGEVERLTQRSVYSENLYLDTVLAINNNISDFKALLALKGRFSESLGYNLGYEYGHYKRLMFFDNNPADTARFIILLDNGGVTRQRFSGEVNYLKNENLVFNLGAAYNLYTTSDVAEAWHKPQLELNFGSRITIIEKLHLRLDYRLLSGIKARESTGLIKTLQPINDLNLAFDLDLTERAGLFLDFRNILGQNYQLYNNYPVNGFQILGGFSIRF